MSDKKVHLTENVATEQLSHLLKVLTDALTAQFEIENLKLYSPVETEGWMQSGRLMLKELPEWLFGFELHLNESTLTFFGEHQWLVDKFKPSRCYVSYEALSVSNFTDSFEEVLAELKDIQAHPIRHFGASLYYGDPISDEQAQKEYEEMKFERRFNKRFDRQTQACFFDFFKKLPQKHPEILAVGITDRHKISTYRIYPRYVVRILISKETTDAVVDSIYAWIETLDVAGVFKGDRIQFRLDGVYDESKALKKCHYVYKKCPTKSEGGV